MKLTFLAAALSIILLLFQFSASSASSAQGVGNEPILTSCNCVAFRLDDIQDYFLDKVQMQVIKTFGEANASLTIGVIGNYIGDDDALLSFLKEEIATRGSVAANHSGPIIEVANHGWNHEDFTRFDKDFQSKLMHDSNMKIFDTLGVRPVVFIPPFNAVNNYTIAAALENDMHFISANATNYPPSLLPQHANASGPVSADTTGTRIYHFPSSASTGDLNADNTQWVGYSHIDTFRAVEGSLRQFGYAVVTMHPQEFSSREGLNYLNIPDHNQILELEDLIANVRNAGLEIVTISQIGYIWMIPEFGDYFLFAVSGVSFVALLAASYFARSKVHDTHF